MKAASNWKAPLRMRSKARVSWEDILEVECWVTNVFGKRGLLNRRLYGYGPCMTRLVRTEALPFYVELIDFQSIRRDSISLEKRHRRNLVVRLRFSISPIRYSVDNTATGDKRLPQT